MCNMILFLEGSLKEKSKMASNHKPHTSRPSSRAGMGLGTRPPSSSLRPPSAALLGSGVC